MDWHRSTGGDVVLPAWGDLQTDNSSQSDQCDDLHQRLVVSRWPKQLDILEDHSACTAVTHPGLLKITSKVSVFNPSAQTAAKKMRLSRWLPSLIANRAPTKAPMNMVIARTMPKRESTATDNTRRSGRVDERVNPHRAGKTLCRSLPEGCEPFRLISVFELLPVVAQRPVICSSFSG